VFLWAVNTAYGAWRVNDIEALIKSAPHVRVAVLQGNIPQEMKWDTSSKQYIIGKYIDQTKWAVEKKAELILWPEASVPFPIEGNTAGANLIEYLRETGSDYLVGALRIDRKPGARRSDFYNSAYLITPNQENLPRYDKSILVPFGEYVPFQSALFFLDRLTQGSTGNLQRGDEMVVFEGSHGAKFASLICYEVIFPRLAREAVMSGANLLTTITNDAWFGRTSAPAQHFGMGVMRSIETHRSLARAANTGYSGFVSPTGQVFDVTGLYQDDHRVQNLPLMTDITFYTAYGDIIAWILGLIAVGAIISTRRGRARNPNS